MGAWFETGLRKKGFSIKKSAATQNLFFVKAKEMKKLSQQRKETDSEYEEKRTALSLAQAELEKVNK